ncbi:MAG: BON domain-containing protein [Kiloniellales bacterium]
MTAFQPIRRYALLCGLLLSCLLSGACSTAGVAVSGAAGAGVMTAQERGFQGGLRDTRIRMDINHLWFQEDEALFRNVNLQVQEGRVLLSGKVETPEMRVAAARLAWQVEGVREVMNEIAVTDKSSLTSAARDSWIATELKTKLLFDREIDAINYSIETVNQVVYLIGLAQDDAELQRVIAHAKDVPYVRQVVSHVILKDDPRRRTAAAPPT